MHRGFSTIYRHFNPSYRQISTIQTNCRQKTPFTDEKTSSSFGDACVPRAESQRLPFKISLIYVSAGSQQLGKNADNSSMWTWTYFGGKVEDYLQFATSFSEILSHLEPTMFSKQFFRTYPSLKQLVMDLATTLRQAKFMVMMGNGWQGIKSAEFFLW